MKLHETLINKLIQVYEVNAGWQEQKKLRAALAALDITVYSQQSTGTDVLVDANELEQKVAKPNR
jgi:hypothetical protein